MWVEGRRGMAKVVPPSQVSGHRKRWGWAHKRKKEREGDEWKEKEERGKGFRPRFSRIRRLRHAPADVRARTHARALKNGRQERRSLKEEGGTVHKL